MTDMIILRESYINKLRKKVKKNSSESWRRGVETVIAALKKLMLIL